MSSVYLDTCFSSEETDSDCLANIKSHIKGLCARQHDYVTDRSLKTESMLLHSLEFCAIMYPQAALFVELYCSVLFEWTNTAPPRESACTAALTVLQIFIDITIYNIYYSVSANIYYLHDFLKHSECIRNVLCNYMHFKHCCHFIV